MVSRLPEDLATRVQGVFLLGPSPRVDFEFHVTEWLGGGDPKTALDVGPEVAKLGGFKVLCFHGQEETDSLCPRLATPPVIDVALPGGHHFGGDYTAIARRLLAETKSP